MKFFKKLLIMLMLMGFASTSVYADDDDYYDEEDEEVAKPKPKAAKKASETSDASDDGSMKVGFYGSIANKGLLGPLEGEIESATVPIGAASRIGLLLNLGSDLELGLGFGLFKFSATITTKTPSRSEEETISMTMYEIVPSLSYQLGKTGFVGYGLGLDVHLASWSASAPGEDDDGEPITVTREPDGMDIAFYPNFILRAEIVKNFQIWLKTGLFIYMPPEDKDDYGDGYSSTTSGSIMSTKTEIGFSFFL